MLYKQTQKKKKKKEAFTSEVKAVQKQKGNFPPPRLFIAESTQGEKVLQNLLLKYTLQYT